MDIAPELVVAARNGHRDAMDTLLESIWPHAYRIAFSIVQHESNAEDAAQEACVAVCRTIASLRSPDAFSVWLYRIVVREAVRTAKRLTPLVQDEVARTPSDVLSADILAALKSLSPDLRAVVVLVYYVGLTSTEASATLSIPPGTVRTRLLRARSQLAALLVDEPTKLRATEVCNEGT